MSDHGTNSRYRKGCRCEPCKEAHRADKAAYYARKKTREAAGLPPNPPGRPAIPLSERPHGDYVTYCKGCRCTDCRTASRDASRERAVVTRGYEPEEITRLRELADSLGYVIHKRRQEQAHA